METMRLAVAAAHDRDLLEAVCRANQIGGVTPFLFGKSSETAKILDDIEYAGPRHIFDYADDVTAAAGAVKYVHDGNADLLMKGMVNTSDFMRAVLDKASGLRSGKLLSHLASFEVPCLDRVLFVTDGGINIAPDLAEKKEILRNALKALNRMGYAGTNVAVLAANEQVNPKAVATVDAADIAKAWKAGEFEYDCLVEGPMALDVALYKEAALHKNIASEVAGAVDLFLTSTIEVGNVLGKSMANIAGAKMAGVVLGAAAPIVLTSRAESSESKLNSILLAANCC